MRRKTCNGVLLRCGVFLAVVRPAQRAEPKAESRSCPRTDLDLRGGLVERASAGTAAVLVFRASEARSESARRCVATKQASAWPASASSRGWRAGGRRLGCCPSRPLRKPASARACCARSCGAAARLLAGRRPGASTTPARDPLGRQSTSGTGTGRGPKTLVRSKVGRPLTAGTWVGAGGHRLLVREETAWLASKCRRRCSPLPSDALWTAGSRTFRVGSARTDQDQ